MTQRFDSFVMLAEMRTGSNLLEERLNGLDGVTCAGELFNPRFVGAPSREAHLGFDLARREADPLGLLAALRAAPGLGGFRFFHDHDPRALDAVLPDPRCAKIILTRNPLDSYISRLIAAETGQWRLGDVRHQRSAKVRFDPVAFEDHVRTLQGFQTRVQRALQISGQSAFHIGYDDLNEDAVIAGLARWLGVPVPDVPPAARIKPQNPAPPADKLLNPEALAEGIARLDRFDLTRMPGLAVQRDTAPSGARPALRAPVLYLPGIGGPDAAVLDWLAALDGARARDLGAPLSIPELRRWLAAHPDRRCFAVLRHPLLRAHQVYLDQVVRGTRSGVRGYLERIHGVRLPRPARVDAEYSLVLHRQGFLAFLEFVRANLAGQTGLPVRPDWDAQSRVLARSFDDCMPDRLLREPDLGQGLAALAAELKMDPPDYRPPRPERRFSLDAICDSQIEAAGRAAYEIDYRVLGFRAWRDTRGRG